MAHTFQFIDNAGIRLRVAVKGSGPLVLFVHGFPESWYSWRHQLDAVAAAGFTAAAMDCRGYGGSDKPAAILDYRMEAMVSDIVAVAYALQPDRPAVLVGHDWGAPIVYASALSRSQSFAAVAGLAVPYHGVPSRPFNEFFKQAFTDRDRFFYQHWFAQAGKAEAEAETDIRRFLLVFFASLSAGAPPWPRKRANQSLLEDIPVPSRLPGWLTHEDLAFYVEEFRHGGFAGPLARYRNHEADFHWYQQFRGRLIEQPALFIGGEYDPALYIQNRDDPLAEMRANCPQLFSVEILPDCGHWTQQERPLEVNTELLDWLARVC